MSVTKVVIGIIENSQHEIWVQQRQAFQSLSGKWEFPGGKVEVGETIIDALARELEEEVGFVAEEAFFSSPSCRKLIELKKNLPSGDLHFHVFHLFLQDVTLYKSIFTKEGQIGGWKEKKTLPYLDMPNASTPMVNALLLPNKIWITPDFDNVDGLFSALETFIERYESHTANAIILRQTQWQTDDWLSKLPAIICYLNKRNIHWKLNTPFSIIETLLHQVKQSTPTLFRSLSWHMNSHFLKTFFEQKKSRESMSALRWVGASIHNEAEIMMANTLNLDYVILSPVCQTTSHPDATPLGWKRFSTLIQLTSIPIYGLGGLRDADLHKCQSLGAQGVSFMGGLS